MGQRDNVDLAHRAADYAYKLMAVHVKQEYDNQITVWTERINDLIAFAKTAFKRHETHLQGIKQEQQADHETAMLALSLLAGPALSWLSATIQYKVFPRLVGKRKITATIVGGSPPAKPELPKPFPSQRPPAPKITPGELVYTIDPLSHDKAAAKVFADLGSKLSEKLLVNPALKAVATDDQPLAQKINMIGDSLSLDLFETNIKNALEEGKKFGDTTIVNYAGTILEDRGYGDKWLEKLDREQPALKDASAGAREDAVRQMIHAAVDAQRREWAKSDSWFYYANDPAPLNDTIATNAMEAEIWRLWIVGEHFEFVKLRRKRGYEIEDEHGSSRIWAKGDSGIEIDLILDRLIDIGVFAGRNQSEMDKIFKRIEDANNRLPPSPLPATPEPWSRTKTIDPEAMRKHQEELRRPAGLLPLEVADVEGIVDTDEELQAILQWATRRKPQTLGGKLASVPRAITPLNVTNLSR